MPAWNELQQVSRTDTLISLTRFVVTKSNDDYNAPSYAWGLSTANEHTNTNHLDFSPITPMMSKFPTPEVDENLFLLF